MLIWLYLLYSIWPQPTFYWQYHVSLKTFSFKIEVFYHVHFLLLVICLFFISFALRHRISSLSWMSIFCRRACLFWDISNNIHVDMFSFSARLFLKKETFLYFIRPEKIFGYQFTINHLWPNSLKVNDKRFFLIKFIFKNRK